MTFTIRITQESKALTPTVWKDVPQFAVICGGNGVGKTQFLQAVARSLGVAKGKESIVAASEGLGITAAEVKYARSDWTLDQAQPTTVNWLSEQRAVAWQAYSEYRKNRALAQSKHRDLFMRLEANVGREQLSHEAFMAGITDDDLISANPGTLAQVGQLFATHRIKAINEQLKALSEGREPSLNEGPWVLLNSLLQSAGLPYQCTAPETDRIDIPFLLEFKHVAHQKTVAPNEMSSGERVILNLFLLLFASNFDGKLPKLLLLDEPDAHLHPAMVSKFISTLDRVLVKEQGMHVIMTSHSPTTVAVCPEEALFEMLPYSATHGDRFQKISRDKAIGILTAGVPALRIKTEHRRQVFVESAADERLYSALSLHLAPFLNQEIALSFIASGRKNTQDGTGCTQVINLVERLNEAGNDSVFGIVDWDNRNCGSGNIFVLAEGARYAIENCIYDPLVLAAFMVKERIFPSVLQSLPKFMDLPTMSNETWQEMVDVLSELLRAKAGTDRGERIRATSIGGPQVHFDSWLFNIQGHRLEELLLETFSSLRRFTGGGPGELMFNIANHVGDNMPQLFPKCLLNVMLKIQGESELQ